jgi:ribA/ribD-fused uncharacterized protein
MRIDKDILQFQGPYRFLSNFFIEPDGTCVESEYQSAKCVESAEAARIIKMSPGNAKRAGRRVAIRPDWNDVRVEIMRSFVERKFADHTGLLRLLLATGNVELVEGNNWGDRFWGRVDNGYGTGENWLGKILMETRVLLEKRALLPTSNRPLC